MDEIVFEVPGDPVPKGRPRFNGHAYTPKRTADYEKLVRACYGDRPKLLGAIRAEIEIRIRMPKKPRTEQAEGKPCRRKGDLDNYAKSVLDALNGIAYEDDKDITELVLSKRWSMAAGVRVRLSNKE